MALEAGVYTCSDCGARGRRILSRSKGKPGRIVAWKQKAKRSPEVNVLTKYEREEIERRRAARIRYGGRDEI